MKDHVIICGFGYNGKKVARELQRQGVEYVVIEREKELVEELYGVDSKGTSKRILVEDAKSEETLKMAGIEDAKALLITVGDDAEAAFITLVARHINSTLPLIAKANKLESMRKIYRAGGTKVVSPSVIGGRMAARAAVKPLVAEFIDRTTFMKDFEIAHFKIGKDSKFYKKKLKDLKLSQKNVSILAIHHEGELIANPPQDAVLDEEDVIVVLGHGDKLRDLG
ncbi:MAG: NAD-binding protein [Candidatus Hydrothermarchaeaceae archaeon]